MLRQDPLLLYFDRGLKMKFASIVNRLDGLGGAKWAVHTEAKALAASGKDVILLTIGEPDVPLPQELAEDAAHAIRSGRTKYADGQGEASLREALAEYYARRSGRRITADSILCLPGTQTCLYTVVSGLAESGDEVMVGDPMYATYEAVIRASGADMVTISLRPEHGFRMQPGDIADRITDRTRALLLTTPHNPTGSILTADELTAIGELALKHDFWIISDEVYSELIFDRHSFSSPLDIEALQGRVVVVSSISKSHAAPGFRSGWCVASAATIASLLPLAEAMLFGNQPFIADMTEAAIRKGSTVSDGMRRRFAARAERMDAVLGKDGAGLGVHRPQAGMFSLLDVTATGLDGRDFADALLTAEGVAVMPGVSFGDSLTNWVRIALTVSDDEFDDAMQRIARFSDSLT